LGAKFDLKVSSKAETEDNKEWKNELTGEVKLAGSVGETDGNITVAVNDKSSVFVKLNALHKLNKSQTVGVSTGLEFPPSKDDATKFDLNLATQWKADAYTSLAGKLGVTSPIQRAELKYTGLKLSLGLTHIINSSATATIGADVDIGGHIGAKSGANSWGFEVKLK